jgi:hypothetical protein
MIALRMGDNGLQAIDVDIKNAEDPQGFLQEFREACQASPIPWNKIIPQTTMSGGVHLVYRTDKPKGNRKLSSTADGKVLIETRGVGGCIVLYDIERFAALEALPVLSIEEEQALLSIAVAFDRSKPHKRMEFKDYNDTYSCVDLLEAEGWKVVGENDIWYEVLRPGNTTSTSSGKVFKDTNRAFIWSSSTSLPTEQSLTPSALACHLKFGGDWKSFSGSLNQVVQWTETTTSTKGRLFKFKDPNDVLMNSSIVLGKPLLGELWQEFELAILFGPTNVGKSILAVEIADAIASGGSILSGRLKSEIGSTTVLYVDFEMLDSQFKKRFIGREFSPNLRRLVLDNQFMNIKTFRKDAIPEIELMLDESKAKVLIIDNLSFIQADNTQAGDAASLISEFDALKKSRKISILIVSHTPKFSKGLSIETTNLAGSAFMSYFIDSLFAVNKAAGKTIYIKQLKQRDGAEVYGSDNVLHCELDFTESGLRVKYIGTDKEMNILDRSNEDLSDRNQKIVKDYRSGGGTVRDLAVRYELSKSQIGDIIKNGSQSVDDADTLPF